MPTVSVVIPTYNRAARLREALDPLLADPALHELIVVVDGARDGSIELLEEIAATDSRLRPLWIENIGDMGARARGVEIATGDVVLLLDDDIVAGPGLVAGHARRHGAEAGLVVVGYMPVLTPARRMPGDFALYVYALDYERRCAAYEDDQSTVLPGLWAGNLSMRRADALRVGLHNPAFGQRFHTDRELGMRLAGRGLRGVFDRSLKATHAYERPLPAYIRDAHRQGAAQARIHELHPEQVPATAVEPFAGRHPRAVRVVLALARRPRLARPLETALTVAVTAAGHARLWPLEEALAKLLRLVGQQRGALDACARFTSPPA
jgi:glycosyltransferase involved in cell wall biosynthesis